MPRFIGLPVVVEAHQYQGNTLNMDGAFNAAFIQFAPSGDAVVRTDYGNVVLRQGDWMVRGQDGAITPMRAAVFEAMFKPWEPAMTFSVEPPINVERVKRPYNRKESVHAEAV